MATSGDPTLGKPPAQTQRVLHVGVDIQANETITTGIDGRATKGVFRFVGSRISKTHPGWQVIA